MEIRSRNLRIGVDVGGTNTDCALLDLTKDARSYGTVLASTKTPTTKNISSGIKNALSRVLEDAEVEASSIQAVAVGTTHFVNALIERKEGLLERVAVIRLCGKFTRGTPPFAGFPRELRRVIEGPHYFVNGGLQIDGSEIASIRSSEILEVCEDLDKQGIESLVVSAVFSPIDSDIRQEEQVARIVREACPHIKVVASKQVANLGLIERENASILNACLLGYAGTVVQELQNAASALDLRCPVVVTSNDGTILSCTQASQLPIRTFSSGPTNSMRGAAFCAALATGRNNKESALVVDIGGTTTEVGMLLPTGFPRQSGAHTYLCGVRLKFAMPQVTSIGLGGGSIVRYDPASHKATLGPDSVGYQISEKAVVFGGDTLTTTDIAVAAGSGSVGTHQAKAIDITTDVVQAAQLRIKKMLEETLDAMKTSAEPVPAYLVGGGAFLAPDKLDGISEVVKLPHAGVANAIGAAIAQIAGTNDVVRDISNTSMADMLSRVEAEASQAAIEAGADPKTIIVVDKECIPVAYTAGRCRFYVKAAGEWTGSLETGDASLGTQQSSKQSSMTQQTRKNGMQCLINGASVPLDTAVTSSFIQRYRPRIVDRLWELSEIDLEWIADGCYILGCGGGGAPTHTFLQCRELVRNGHRIRVADLEDLPDEGMVGWGGGLGSPEVANERMLGEEYNEALEEVRRYSKIERYTALTALEIGGSNGMINFVAGSSRYFDLPIADNDCMGRAYPTGCQVTPNVFDETCTGKNILPVAMSSGDGSMMLMTRAKSDLHVDPALRAACLEMGTLTGAAKRPLSVSEMKKYSVRNTVSLAWRIGRAVDLARKTHNIDQVASIIIDAVGGPDTASLLFAGKIVAVNRRTYKGHLIGEIIVKAIVGEEVDAASKIPKFEGRVSIPFKNENLVCEQASKDGSTKLLATVPDLISVIDAVSGSALGTPDYKYGLRVLVLGITAAPQWTDTPRGLALGGPAAFGMPDVPYVPIGRYIKPRSVIEEFA